MQTPALNNVFSKLASPAGVSDTSLTLDSTAGFPTQGWAALQGSVDFVNEVVGWTGISGNTLTGVSRGLDGTTAEAHVAGSLVGVTLIARHIKELQVTHGSTAERMTLGLALDVTDVGRRFWDTDLAELFVWMGGDWGVPTIGYGMTRGIRDYLIEQEADRALVLADNYRKGDRMTDLTTANCRLYVCKVETITHNMEDWMPVGRQS